MASRANSKVDILGVLEFLREVLDRITTSNLGAT
jgi:hypothetical protein